ncbi:preprotein translocase, YajC subunit [alpha proteobacterium BAL199]|jgi:preprotein translocase subunit YajC|nr:preprotein translocase, YajC subunit [alpha proteobacterium BAL199]
MLISPAYAQAAGGLGGGSDMIMSLAPLVLIFAVFYFLLIRPQQKKAKEHREMLGNVRRNDKIVTNGGLVGTVIKVSEGDDLLTVEIASGVKVQVVRSMIADVRTKGQPVSSKAPAKGKAAKTVEADNDDEDDAETPKSAT